MRLTHRVDSSKILPKRINASRNNLTEMISCSALQWLFCWRGERGEGINDA
jgi:hypothetical protein